MTEEKRSELTAEEQEVLRQENPVLLEALEKNPTLAAPWLASWRKGREISEEAKESAADIRQEVFAAIPKEQQGSLHVWMGYPTDLTRCSPFFPMNPKELGHREFLQDLLITSAGWGEIKYTGPMLSTYEEDALMALLAIFENQRTRCVQTDENAQKTYSYCGPVWPLLRLLGYKKPGKDAYKRTIAALKLMMSSVFELSLSAGKTKSGNRRAPRRIVIDNLLSHVDWNEKTKELKVTVNPFFYETYMAGRVTFLDVVKRVELKGVIAKALYRFVQSQQKNPVFAGHFLTLADSLNLDRNREQPAWKTRQNLKSAITELIRASVLTKKSRFVEQDFVHLERAGGTFPVAEIQINKIK